MSRSTSTPIRAEGRFARPTPRHRRNFSRELRRRAKRLAKTNAWFGIFHDLRRTRATQFLDRGVPVHQVAAGIGDDPAILMKVYAKLTNKKGDTMIEALNAMATNFLKSQ